MQQQQIYITTLLTCILNVYALRFDNQVIKEYTWDVFQISTFKQPYKGSCISFWCLAFQQEIQAIGYSFMIEESYSIMSIVCSARKKQMFPFLGFDDGKINNPWFMIAAHCSCTRKAGETFDVVPLCLLFFDSELSTPKPDNGEKRRIHCVPALIGPPWKQLKNEGHRTNPAHKSMKRSKYAWAWRWNNCEELNDASPLPISWTTYCITSSKWKWLQSSCSEGDNRKWIN